MFYITHDDDALVPSKHIYAFWILNLNAKPDFRRHENDFAVYPPQKVPLFIYLFVCFNAV